MGLPLVIGDRISNVIGRQDVSYINSESNIIIIDASRPMVEELRDHIDRLARDLTLRRAMSAGAARVAAKLLDWNVLTLKTLC